MHNLINIRPRAAPRSFRIAAFAISLVSVSGCSQSNETLAAWLETAAGHPLGPLLVIGIFLASGFVAAPLSLVMIPTIVIYGPVFGSLWTGVGATLAGALFFWLGSQGAVFAERFRRDNADRTRIGRLMGKNGIAAVAIARNLPLGPYPLVNLALGASPVTMPHFLIGNLIGLAPWIAVYAVAGSELRGLLANPSPGAWLRMGLVVAGAVAIIAVTSRWISRRELERTTTGTGNE